MSTEEDRFRLLPEDAEGVARDIDFCLECKDYDTARSQLRRLIELLSRTDELEALGEAAIDAVGHTGSRTNGAILEGCYSSASDEMKARWQREYAIDVGRVLMAKINGFRSAAVAE